MISGNQLPGRFIRDKHRSPFGLGWEYRRRKLTVNDCPLVDNEEIIEFRRGYNAFHCSDKAVNRAMLDEAAFEAVE